MEGDAGQPTYFLPRRQRFIDRVRVPANFGKRKRGDRGASAEPGTDALIAGGGGGALSVTQPVTVTVTR